MKLLSITALVGLGAYVIWTAFRLVNAPSTEEAMHLSLKALEIPDLRPPTHFTRMHVQ
jgi:hypothetical protein